ncbi:major facilitator superfamily domain-containing protein [Mycena floridula]|nr:major facilitator superfamily domain-containing protein [Mycena floridula]
MSILPHILNRSDMQGYGDDSIQVETIYLDMLSGPVLFTSKREKAENSLTDVEPVTHSASVPSTLVDSHKFWWKLDIQLILIALMILFFSLLDRSNISNAMVAGLPQSLHLTSYDYSLALTITLVPYILIEIPSGLLIKVIHSINVSQSMIATFNPAIWCSLPAMCYGGPWRVNLNGASVRVGLITNKRGLIVCRFFLGLFEGGVQPGLVFYLASFYPRYKLQWRVGVVMSCVAVVAIFSSLAAAAIERNMDGFHGRRAWSWIFILEGAAGVFCGLLLMLLVPRSPRDVRLLSAEEKDQLITTLNSDPAYIPQDHRHAMWKEVVSSCFNVHLWLLSLIAFLVGTGSSGLAYFVPTIVQNLGHKGSDAQLFSAILAAVSAIVSIVISYLSDKYQSRGALLILSATISIAGYALFFATPHALKIRYGAMFLMNSGTFSIAPTFYSWISNNAVSQTERATNLAMIAISVNAGGILAVWLFGALSVAPAYSTAALTMVIFMCIVLILTIINMFVTLMSSYLK